MDLKDEIIFNLNLICKTYDGITKLIVSTKNRMSALNPDAEFKHDTILNGEVRGKRQSQGLEQIKNRISRQIEKELVFWPVWTEWMKGIPGIGPFIAGNLIILYYYRFMPVCKKCGSGIEKKEGTYYCKTCEKSLKGDGLLSYKLDLKDFPKISAWWSYMGEANDENGKKIKMKKGVQCNWSPKGRALSYQVGESFVKFNGDHHYKAFYLKQKKKRERTHPEASKMYRHNMARRETSKLFLSHFWQVAREIDGKEITEPYVSRIPGHTIIQPYYWKEK
jgi:hypothetical protein